MRYVTTNADTATIAVEGDYTLKTTVVVMTELQQAYQQGCTKVVIDFKDTTYIDSSVIRDCSRIRKHVKPENFSAKNATGKVLAALSSANLDEWLK